MTRFIYPNFWKTIEKQIKKAGTIRAAIAYVTRKEPLPLREGDVLIVDASDQAIVSKQTSREVIKALFNKGVELYSCPNLHAKVIIADKVVYASSANLSESSLKTLIEAGIETDHPTTVTAAKGFIERLKKQSERIDKAFITRINQLEIDNTSDKHPRNRSLIRIKRGGEPVTWLLGVQEITKPLSDTEQTEVDTGTEMARKQMINPDDEVGWIRLAKSSRLGKEAKVGDVVILIWKPAGHKLPTLVYKHSAVLFNAKGKQHNWLYHEEALDEDEQALSWAQFKRLCKRVGIRTPSANSERILSPKLSDALNDLWDQARKR